MARKISSMHITYTDGDGTPRSESFDPEELEDMGGANFNQIIREYLADDCELIVVTIETEEI